MPPARRITRSAAPAAPRVTPLGLAHHADAPLPGREEIVGRLLDICRAAASAPVVALLGPAGSGRSALLARLRARVEAHRLRTVQLRITREEHDVAHLAARLADELGKAPREAVRVPLTRLLAQHTEQHGPLVVIVDDAQRIAPGCLAELARMVNPQNCHRVTFVCAFRTPAAGAPAELARLRDAGLVHEERLRPLDESAMRALLTDNLQAEPAPQLVHSVRRDSRGLPAFAHALLDGYREAGCLRIVDQRVCPVGGRGPAVRITHPLFAGLSELGSPCWPVLKALAVLHPLRGNVPELIARATDLPEHQVLEALKALRATGVLTGEWRFRVPALGALLTTCLGPYERRRVSELAVLALWNGAATCADPEYLAERLATAGRQVDPNRAAAELVQLSGRTPPERGDLADHWGRAAARLCTESGQRAEVLHRHAVTSALHMRFESAAESADEVLRDHPQQLSPDSAQELRIVRLVAAAGTGALGELVPERSPSTVVTRAAGLCLLGRWAQAHDELVEDLPLWSSSESTNGMFGRVLLDSAAAVLGRSRWSGSARGRGTTADVLRILTRALTLFGGLREPAQGVQVAAERAVHFGHAGRWDEALEHARSGLATAAAWGGTPGHTALFRQMADIFVARGQLQRARTIIAEAREQHLLLPHLLAIPEAELESTTGATDRARAHLTSALRAADADGVLIGTDELLRALVELETRCGDHAAAREHAARLEQVAARLDDSAARRNDLLGRVLVHGDTAAAAEAIELAESRQRPCELARTLATVGGSAAGSGTMLRTAYELFGELDALIPRARLRLLMRERKVTVPGRGTTVAENERLLATLIAEGLTNAQLATILGTSEKGIEGRLTRLFQRAGFRSRAELATALLHGDFSVELT